MNLLEIDRRYFNIEISWCKTTLVFNASKKGIDSFLEKYGTLELPPQTISCAGLNRKERRWSSWRIIENMDAQASDPTPYSAMPNDELNMLVNDLSVNFLPNEDSTTILYAYLQGDIPILAVNKSGWQKFLHMMNYLRDESYWFYVVPTSVADTKLPLFKMIECIRLEPEEEIFLSASLDIEGIESGKDSQYFGVPQLITGNSGGLLLLSQWIEKFASSETISEDLLNQWRQLPKCTGATDYDDRNPTWIRLRKIELSSPYPIFSFEGRDDGSKDLYIFGNSEGFSELAQIIEEYSFSSDHEEFGKNYPEKRFRGDAAIGVLGPKGFRSLSGLNLLGGGFYTPKYDPRARRFVGSEAESGEARKNFVNKRSLPYDWD